MMIDKNNNTLTYLIIGGLFVGLLLFSGRVLAEDFRDQQDRMREEYYQDQERQRGLDSNRIEQEMRQDQYEQSIRKQEQILEMKQEKVRMDQVRKDVEQKQHELQIKQLKEQKEIDEKQRNPTPKELDDQKKLIDERKNQESPIDFEKEKELKRTLDLY